MQFILTAIIILGAVGYAAWRCYDNFREGGEPCRNCELKKNCKKFGSVKDNSYLCTRK